MKVYILLEDYVRNECYAPIIAGCYSSMENALIAKDKQRDQMNPELYTYEIDEWELDSD